MCKCPTCNRTRRLDIIRERFIIGAYIVAALLLVSAIVAQFVA